MAILLNPTNVNIEINDDIGLMCISEEFSNHAPRETYLIQSQYEAARAFFQAERDDALGRWRDTENMDMVAYPGSVSLDWVVVLDESTGGTDVVFRQPRKPTKDSDFRLVADRYFATHLDPEPRPWEEAKVGEIWEIGLLELGPSACLVTEGDFVEISGRFEVAIGSSLIESGRRIWPEPRIGGAE